MAVYHYKAKDKMGRTIKGHFEAQNREEVLKYIRERSYYPLNVEIQKRSWNININLDINKRVKVRDLAIFCRQFATTLKSGITVVEGLSLLSKQTVHKKLSQVISDICDDILKGSSLSEAMGKESSVFPNLLISMVESGEASSNLDRVMEDMADHFEKEHKLNQKIKSAFTYPIIVSIVAVLVVGLLLTFVMPTFVSIFDSFGSELPFPTKMILSISSSLKNFWYVYLFITSITIYSVKKYIDTPKGRFIIDKLKVKIPVFGELNNKVFMERFASTISVLLSSGVDILDAIEIVQKVVGNEYIKASLEKVKIGVREGYGLGKTIESTKVFPPLVYQMIDIGERSGSLDYVLRKISTFYEDEVENSIQQLTTMIEPLIIVILGGIVGFIVISMILPVFDLYNIIG
ncbi:type II secretion system F family protein [Alkalibaculum bacchi]|uniref:type II secretion system F family protein n=1 Tax=Alkalibaculum bacchi TaxID=645887 RepID=UPI0026F1C5C4|nr:type II secretion system F family protein [Alkalibaculum bacchi]